MAKKEENLNIQGVQGEIKPGARLDALSMIQLIKLQLASIPRRIVVSTADADDGFVAPIDDPFHDALW